MKSLSIKDHAELRHALAHIIYSIQALSRGSSAEAEYELESIAELVFWNDDDAMTEYVERLYEMQQEAPGEEELQGQKDLQEEVGPEELQGQEELQEEVGEGPAK